MPTLLELFKTQRISEGTNAGKTVEEAYTVQNSKDVQIQTTNPILQPLTEKINKRRKDTIRLKETRLEEETAGLKAFGDTAKLVLYGGDYFRIINGTTRSKQLMLRSIGASGAGLADSLTDKIGGAVGNLVGDKISNLFLKKEDRVPPKLDTRALGTDILADVASRTLGRLLPEPMIPSKVAEEFEKGRAKKEKDFIHEYDIDKKIIRLKNKKGIPKLIDSLLKNNKDIMGQSKDVLMSTAGTIAAGLVSTGISKLSGLIFNKTKNAKVGPQKQAQPSNTRGFIWSSAANYSKARNISSLRDLDVENRGDLSSYLLESRINVVKAINKTLGLPAPNEAVIKKSLLSTPETYTERPVIKTNNIITKRALLDGADGMNSLDNVTYAGTSTKDTNNVLIDDYDFIPLKFYNIYKNQTLQFRCTLSDLTETYSPTWDSNKFIGNPFPFYTYSGIERSVTFGFKVFSLNLEEHQLAWERLNELGQYTYPSAYKGAAGAVVPPIIQFTLGNMYILRECFIENLTYSIDENTPWEIGLNEKLLPSNPSVVSTGPYKAGWKYDTDASIIATKYKLPMIVNVEITLKFIENANKTSQFLYDYNKP
jgi:hypothetical protein